MGKKAEEESFSSIRCADSIRYEEGSGVVPVEEGELDLGLIFKRQQELKNVPIPDKIVGPENISLSPFVLVSVQPIGEGPAN